MKKYSIWKLCLAVALAFTLGIAEYGEGGGDTVADNDGDGIPNAADAAPNDAARFVDNVTVLLTGLTPAGGGFTAATAVNNAGKVAGYSEDATAIKAVRWTVNAATGSTSAPETLNPLAGAANDYSEAYGINNTGVTVGESESGANNFVAAFWPAGATTATALSLTGAAAPAAAYGINNAATAQIVGEATIGGRLHAVLWNNSTAAPVDLGLLPGGTFSAAYAINENGLVVGEADNAGGATRAVAWRVNPAGVKTLGPVDLGVITVADVDSAAFDVDSSGRVVGEAVTSAGTVHAGMWTLNSTTLQPAAKTDLGANGSAFAINEANRIVGHLGATSVATVWDTRNTNLPNTVAVETTFSQAIGLNDGNLVVGVQGTRAFVAIPKAQADTTAPVMTASPGGGTYSSSQSVTLTADEPAVIYYTIDGTEPTAASNVYSEAISIASTTTLRFFAKDAAGNVGAVQTQIYYIVAVDRGAISGRVSVNFAGYDGLGVKNATVSLQGTIYFAPTDANGNFILQNLPLGSYTLVVAAPGMDTQTQNVSLTGGNHLPVMIPAMSIAGVNAVQGDANDDKHLGLEDAIYILQILTRLRP